ncbi:hypothetical protein KIH23_13380 [Flavobacterium sp. CYK-55]|uniref:hypothetical protein n=1 Tax=Flavobacterium sp. CYK-55 TaxID=2835529 RepID=UPI001BCFFAB0|nr:hypothetical protein [Flavobacterium sp. CYK-55]MBS7788294.1 hypothetical protein [Flavobacterium sp. CYK-55]
MKQLKKQFLRLGAVIWLALLSSKFAHSFHTQSFFTGIASTQSLEKIKTCCEAN